MGVGLVLCVAADALSGEECVCEYGVFAEGVEVSLVYADVAVGFVAWGYFAVGYAVVGYGVGGDVDVEVGVLAPLSVEEGEYGYGYVLSDGVGEECVPLVDGEVGGGAL